MLPPTATTARLRRTTARTALRPRRSAMPEAGGQDLELVAVLRDRAPRKGDPLFGKRVGDLLVGVRVRGVLRLDHPLDLVLDPEGGGEEVAEGNDLTLRQHHVLLGGFRGERR